MGLSIIREAALGVMLVGVLVMVAGDEPEGYRGGEGRAPGTPYVSGELTITVRGAAVEGVRSGSTWSCGGVVVKATGSVELVTVSLVLSNPTKQAVSTHLANMDLVVAPERADAKDTVRVEEGACVKEGRAAVTDVTLGAKTSKTVSVQFLVARRWVPKILVYNDDDFPALFALPPAKRAR